MVKYAVTAVALKIFSSNAIMRRVYRKLGNNLGNRRRSLESMPGYYAERLRRIIRLQKQFGLVRDGDRILELGTGWLHWEAITLRLLCRVEAILFDVWDNRQLGGLKNYLRQLRLMLPNGFDLSHAEVERMQTLIEEILRVESFHQLYELLGFEYVVESRGSLAQFQSDSVQLVVSGGVLEHVKREWLPTLMVEMHRILKPGGWAVHSIDTSDHLAHYDRRVCRKRYLGFSDRAWDLLWQNEVQYINRVQRSEWLELFQSNGFEVIEEDSEETDLTGLKVAESFARMQKRDLECTVLGLALRKPFHQYAQVAGATTTKRC